MRFAKPLLLPALLAALSALSGCVTLQKQDPTLPMVMTGPCTIDSLPPELSGVKLGTLLQTLEALGWVFIRIDPDGTVVVAPPNFCTPPVILSASKSPGTTSLDPKTAAQRSVFEKRRAVTLLEQAGASGSYCTKPPIIVTDNSC